MNIIEHPLKIKDQGARAFISKLSLQEDGSLYCALAFADELLLHLEANKKGNEIKSVSPLAIRKEFGSDAVAVCSGLQATTSGDTAFSVLHRGALPSALTSLVGKKWPLLDSLNFMEFLNDNPGGMGISLRHSIGQIQKGKLQVRRSREAGALVDVMLIGDNLFGLSGCEIWREPYLNTEKRYSLRGDLQANGQLHRDADDNFWLFGRDDKLFRLKTHDIKAKPTFKKIHGPILSLSSASRTDGWLYGVCGEDNKELIRLRLNRVTQEEDIQTIKVFSEPITGLCAADLQHGPFLMVATSNMERSQLWRWDLEAGLDPELIPEVKEGRLMETLPGYSYLQHLQLRQISESQYQFWASSVKSTGESLVLSFTLD
jgi:hypothetical protein